MRIPNLKLAREVFEMQRIKRVIVVSFIVTLCFGWMVSMAGAEMVRKIVLFHDGISQEDKMDYLAGWEAFGVSVLMDIPFMNGMVLCVPDEMTSDALADDDRVESVEDDQRVVAQPISASGDGGAGDGGAGDGGAGDGGAGDGGAGDGGAGDGGAGDGGAGDGGAGDGGADTPPPPVDFIHPVQAPPDNHRPWGFLHVYDQYYHPKKLTYKYDPWDAHRLLRPYSPIWEDLKTVRVAVFDTGVDYSHSDIEIAGGINLLNMGSGFMDDNGHGTHISGTIGGRHVGVAYGVELYAVKVLDAYAMGDISSLIMGLQWAIDHEIDIVNMSLAFRDDHPAVRRAVQMADGLGLIMVAAVGNHSNWEDDPRFGKAKGDDEGDDDDDGDEGEDDDDDEDVGAAGDGGAGDGGAGDGGAGDGGAGDGGAGDGGAGDGGAGDGGAGDGGAGDGGAGDGGAGNGGDTAEPYSVMYPAKYPEVIAVSAHDAYDQVVSFANTGPEVDLIAPGTDIVSLDLGDGNYGVSSGTSTAAAHVTGAVALMLALDCTLSSEEIKSILEETSEGGLLDLVDALEEIEDREADDGDGDEESDGSFEEIPEDILMELIERRRVRNLKVLKLIRGWLRFQHNDDDGDIEEYSDRTRQDILMELVHSHVSNPRVLKLIRVWLRAGEKDGTDD
jgi:hypothetical protein